MNLTNSLTGQRHNHYEDDYIKVEITQSGTYSVLLDGNKVSGLNIYGSDFSHIAFGNDYELQPGTYYVLLNYPETNEYSITLEKTN